MTGQTGGLPKKTAAKHLTSVLESMQITNEHMQGLIRETVTCSAGGEGGMYIEPSYPEHKQRTLSSDHSPTEAGWPLSKL